LIEFCHLNAEIIILPGRNTGNFKSYRGTFYRILFELAEIGGFFSKI